MSSRSSLQRYTGCFLALLGLTLSVGCSSGPQGSSPGLGADTDTGSAQFEVRMVPPGVQCIQITIEAPAFKRVDSFPVVAAQSALFSSPALPPGDVTFSAAAFGTACGSITSAALASWFAAPVTALIVPAGTSSVSLVMQPAGNAAVGVDFPDSGSGGGSTLARGIWDSTEFDSSTWQ
jgi:hypothetical protein